MKLVQNAIRSTRDKHLHSREFFEMMTNTFKEIVPSTDSEVIILIDTRDSDGIEAWVSLDEDDICGFQQEHYVLKIKSVLFEDA